MLRCRKARSNYSPVVPNFLGVEYGIAAKGQARSVTRHSPRPPGRLLLLVSSGQFSLGVGERRGDRPDGFVRAVHCSDRRGEQEADVVAAADEGWLMPSPRARAIPNQSVKLRGLVDVESG